MIRLPRARRREGPRHDLFLTPDLFGPFGGIAYHARVVLQALTGSGRSVRVVALHDAHGGPPHPGWARALERYTACRSNRAVFVARCLASLSTRPGHVLVEHVHLADLGWILARLSGARLDVFCHGVEAWEPLSGRRRAALRRADTILCVSRLTARRVIEANGVDPEKVRVIHSSLDPNAESVASSPRGRRRSLITVGRLARGESYKGHDLVIRSLPLLRERFPDLTYDIIGAGDWRPGLEELARAQGVDDMVVFHGGVSDEEMNRALETAAVYVMPSRGEGFGIAFLQAMAHALPVVAGNTDAAPEVVQDGVTGYVVDPTDVEALAGRLATLLADEPLRIEMGRQGMARLHEQFSFHAFSRSLDALLTGPRTRPPSVTGGGPLRVLHVIPSLGPARGGPSFALPALARELASRGLTVEVCATDDDGAGHLPVPLGRPVRQNGVTALYFSRQTRFYTVSWPLTRWLIRHAGDYDLLHIHALFSYPTVAAALAARLHRVPYVVRPLGTLNRYGMTQRRPLLKRLSFRLIEGPILRGAAAVQYTSEDEREQARELGVDRPAAVIPPGVDLDDLDRLPPAEEFFNAYPQLAGRPIVLFLSRLDPKKGLDLLLPAFAALRASRPEAALVIAGDGDGTFVSGLQEEVRRLGLERDVVFAGFLEGRCKRAALAAAEVFVLPSYSENFGIACVEALGAGLPVVVTRQVGIAPEVERYGAGAVVAADAESLRAGIERVLGDEGEHRRMSAAAAALAREEFSLAATGERTVALYLRVLGMEPESVGPVPAPEAHVGGGAA